MSEPPVERDELEQQEGDLLPDREAMSVSRDPFETAGIVPPPIEPLDPA